MNEFEFEFENERHIGMHGFTGEVSMQRNNSKYPLTAPMLLSQCHSSLQNSVIRGVIIREQFVCHLPDLHNIVIGD